MNNPLLPHIKNICFVLNKHSVEYMIIGGTAMAFYDAYRMTKRPTGELADKHDFDFWYNPTYSNYYNLLRALKELGFDITEHWEQTQAKPKESYFKYECEYFTLDFLPIVLGLPDFNRSYQKKQTRKLDKERVYILGSKELYITKEASGRPKDKEDIEFMKSRGV